MAKPWLLPWPTKINLAIVLHGMLGLDNTVLSFVGSIVFLQSVSED